MKKLLLIITLFVSSFFLFCNKEVKAIELNITPDFSLLNDDALSLKEKTENYISTNEKYSKYYVIFKPYNSNSISSMIFKSTFKPSDIYYTISGSMVTMFFGDHVMDQFIATGSSSYTNYIRFYFSPNLSQIIYSNFDIPITNDLIINYTYNDFTYVDSINTTNKITTLEDIYRNYSGIVEENPHQEEIDKVTNFYTMVIQKISYLAEQITNNYILLSIIGIFIVIFVFLLIFRRFL